MVNTLKMQKVLMLNPRLLHFNMFISDDAVPILTQLGLTPLESKVYIVLCKYGKLGTKEISKLTKTAQADIYRVANSLQQKGLVEKQIEKPVSFRSVPFDIGAAFLLERKKTEHKALQQKTEQLSLQFKQKGIPEPLIGEDAHFLLIPKREHIVKKIGEAIDRSKRSVDLFLSWKRLYRGMTIDFAETAKTAWTRDVKFRIVVENPREPSAQKKAGEFCELDSMCEIRFLSDWPKTVFGLYDKKEVFIIVNPKRDLHDSPALWSNNQSLVTAIQEYFELLWLTSMESPDEAQT